MARLPLTVYLPRADLARLEIRARSLAMARSALAGHAIRALLDGREDHDVVLAEDLRFMRAAVEELINAHPQADSIRARLVGCLDPYAPPQNDRNAP